MAGPVKVYKAGRVECAIFYNEQFKSYSFKFQKSYKNEKTGEWKNTDYFSDTDMGDLSALCDHVRESRVKEKKFDPKPTPEPEQNSDVFEDDIPF